MHEATRDALKGLRASAKAFGEAAARLLVLNEHLESRLVARLVAQYQKRKTAIEDLLAPELERLKKEIARLELEYARALAAKKRERDPGGASVVGRAFAKVHDAIERLGNGELENDPFYEFEALESKAFERVSALLERVSLEAAAAELASIDEELGTLGERLAEDIEEAS